MLSLGRAFLTAFATVSPPIQESKIPMGKYFFTFRSYIKKAALKELLFLLCLLILQS